MIAQKAALERQIQAEQIKAKAEAVARVRKLMTEYGLTTTDLAMPSSRKRGGVGSKVAPKYRDPVSGSTWSGRGLKPKWMVSALESGRSIQDFAV